MDFALEKIKTIKIFTILRKFKPKVGDYMKCPICDTEFEFGFKSYCSRECYAIAHGPGKETVGRKIYLARKKRGTQLDVPKGWSFAFCANPECENPFYVMSGHDNYLYCCPSCGKQAYKLRNNDSTSDTKKLHSKKVYSEPSKNDLLDDAIKARKAGLSYGMYTSKDYAPVWDDVYKVMRLPATKYQRPRKVK